MHKTLPGAGIGFRREFIKELNATPHAAIDFMEIAPENWILAGGKHATTLRTYSERYPFICHGLSLSLGGTHSLDTGLLVAIKQFMNAHSISLYTEHLSWCADDGHLYDLLPLPCTEEAVKWVANRIRQTQDILQMQIGIENASYYFTPPGAEMTEAEFICNVIAEAGCLLHLDINNVYVNSINFGFNANEFIEALPLEHLCYLHVAGHHVESDGLIVDTHGAAVIDPVWALLESVCANPRTHAAQLPICLERDFNFPTLPSLLDEVEKIRNIQRAYTDSCTRRLA